MNASILPEAPRENVSVPWLGVFVRRCLRRGPAHADRVVRPSAGRTVAECLLSVPVVLGASDLAVELVEMSVPSAQKGQA